MIKLDDILKKEIEKYYNITNNENIDYKRLYNLITKSIKLRRRNKLIKKITKGVIIGLSFLTIYFGISNAINTKHEFQEFKQHNYVISSKVINKNFFKDLKIMEFRVDDYLESFFETGDSKNLYSVEQLIDKDLRNGEIISNMFIINYDFYSGLFVYAVKKDNNKRIYLRLSHELNNKELYDIFKKYKRLDNKKKAQITDDFDIYEFMPYKKESFI